ncbi:S8 family serine peptidase [Motilibacter peucedani]|nr:S8 family serine peptidase [Motilibacter peucedani]
MELRINSHSWRAAAVVAAACAAWGVAGPASSASAATPPTPKPAKGHEADLAVKWGDDTSGESTKAAAGTGKWDPNKDNGALPLLKKQASITDFLATKDLLGRPLTGTGVTVALIDTGITPVLGLDAPGKVVNGPDLSFDSQLDSTRYTDGFGHGTHMAGIIAGSDTTAAAVKTGAKFAGVAPGASLLNMKVAAADGGADVTQVIAAIDWVVQHRNDNGMNVRVINLSYGVHSTQPAAVDPLAKAVESAWKNGIVVVASTGNDGIANPVLMPAADPYVISVGAVDHEGTADEKDDQVASFSNGGDATRRPDLLAPGKSVVSLRDPGSYVDLAHPEGLVPGDTTGRFFRGSGTSQATAVVSGAVALMLQARPWLTPDQVKGVLKATADPLHTYPQPAMGAGVIDMKDMQKQLALFVPSQDWTRSTGTGSLAATRGGESVADPASGATLAGETDAMGQPWNAANWAAASDAGKAWSGGTWNGRTWTGTSWTPQGYGSVAWTGASWTGTDWQARSWRADSWDARSWRADSWDARSWRGLY